MNNVEAKLELLQRIQQIIKNIYYPTTDYRPSYCDEVERRYFEDTECSNCEKFVPKKYRYLNKNGEIIEVVMCVLCRECICDELEEKRDEGEDCCSQHTRCVCVPCECGDFCMCVCSCESEPHKCEECPLHP